MSLIEQFDIIKADMELKNEIKAKNSEAALVFVLNHLETLRQYKSYRTRSQFRSHVIDLLNKQYGDGNYSKDDVLKVMSKNGYYSSPVYFFTSFFIMALIDGAVNYFFPNPYLLIVNLAIMTVGTLGLTVIMDMWKMKG